MDETTFPFSKKVLDRANTIEFNEVNAKKYPHQDGIVEWTQFRHTDGSLFTP